MQIWESRGDGGKYVYADLEELDAITAELKTLLIDIHRDDRHFRVALNQARSPAKDGMSTGQAAAYRDAVRAARLHNQAMIDYADSQLAKLVAARAAYAGSDAAAEERLRSLDKPDR